MEIYDIFKKSILVYAQHNYRTFIWLEIGFCEFNL